jgi:microcystin-dependent protein
MANLTETGVYAAGVYQLEVTDQVLGGAGGIANQQAQQLANRTGYLKAILDSMVGMVVPYAGVSAPSGWLFCYGQAISRTTFASLFNALTLRPTGNTTNGSPTISSVSQDLTSGTLGYSVVGMPISGPGIPAGAKVAAVTSNSITLSANATATASGVALVVAPHGVGDGSTTFNVPDTRGRAVAGRDDMGGTAAQRLQVTTATISTTNASTAATVSSAAGLSVGMFVFSANVPSGTTITAISGTSITLSANATATASGTAARFSVLNDPQSLGGTGGSATHQLTVGQLAAHTHLEYSWIAAGGAQTGAAGGNFGQQQTGSTGGDQPHPNVQPTIVLNHIIKT